MYIKPYDNKILDKNRVYKTCLHMSACKENFSTQVYTQIANSARSTSALQPDILLNNKEHFAVKPEK